MTQESFTIVKGSLVRRPLVSLGCTLYEPEVSPLHVGRSPSDEAFPFPLSSGELPFPLSFDVPAFEWKIINFFIEESAIPVANLITTLHTIVIYNSRVVMTRNFQSVRKSNYCVKPVSWKQLLCQLCHNDNPKLSLIHVNIVIKECKPAAQMLVAPIYWLEMQIQYILQC